LRRRRNWPTDAAEADIEAMMWRATAAAVAACCLIAIMQLSGMWKPSSGVTVLSYHPPWEQRPTHYNRYRFKSSVQQLAEVNGVKKQQHSVHAKTVQIDEGRAIFAKLKAAAGSFNAKVQGKGKATPLKLAEDVESTEAPVDEEPTESAAEDEGPKTIYVYDGRETKPFATDLVTFILAAGFAMPDIRYIKSSSDADIRYN
jgi:hypothetical protein